MPISKYHALPRGPRSLALVVCISCTCIGLLKPSLAQAPDKEQKVAAIKESLAKNQAALKQYTWTETTQISLKGEVKKQEQKQCQYGPDGKVQKTPIGSAEAQQSQQQSSGGGRRRGGGALKKEIVEKKVDELKDYMEKVGALVKEYVPPDPQKIKAAGGVSVQPSPDGAALTIKNYVKQGDTLAIGFNTTTKKISSYHVDTYLDNPKDDPVSLAVTFSGLPDGTNYAQQTLLDAPGKKIQVKLTNADYRKITP
jgi:hypothetical protein